MRKLFFDDVRKAPDDTWMVARGIPDAKELMTAFAFDIMSLDHDIGFQMICEKCYEETDWDVDDPITHMLRIGCNHTENGTTLAKWMIENLKAWPSLIFIHSANPYGVRRMQDILSVKTPTIIGTFDPRILRDA